MLNHAKAYAHRHRGWSRLFPLTRYHLSVMPPGGTANTLTLIFQCFNGWTSIRCTTTRVPGSCGITSPCTFTTSTRSYISTGTKPRTLSYRSIINRIWTLISSKIYKLSVTIIFYIICSRLPNAEGVKMPHIFFIQRYKLYRLNPYLLKIRTPEKNAHRPGLWCFPLSQSAGLIFVDRL